MKIVFLDRKTIGEDLNLDKFNEFGEVVMYNFSKPEEIPARVAGADIIILNKAPINRDTIGDAKNLKLVCVTATGTNNLDKEYLAEAGIEWRNVAGYSTDSVAQHTFALLLYVYEKLAYYDNYVKSEKYVNDEMFTHFAKNFNELAGKKWGIIGLGNIGKKVADIATVFGCDVSYFSTTGNHTDDTYPRVELDELLRDSDIVSIHAPLTDDTFHLIDAEALSKMKETAVLLNVGRGPIIDEQALADALENNIIAAAGVDVLDVEPMREDNPLRKIKNPEKLIITPHIAWASMEARNRLMDIIYNQIKDFLK
ncbi:MAG: D-2-hydroxyacid dehydrogenase [Lachnospiraceae bacterium]|nr:D-2-hydroxyacid dehydrogenase [Lachnospiraceae bacterium]